MVAEARQLLKPVIDLLRSDMPAAARARHAVTMLNGLFEESRAQVPVYLAALAAAPHAPDVQAGMSELWADMRRALADDISTQQANGNLHTWVVPDAMAALIIDLVNGVVLASVADPDGPAHDEVAGQFLLLLLAARTTPQTAAPPTQGAPR